MAKEIRPARRRYRAFEEKMAKIISDAATRAPVEPAVSSNLSLYTLTNRDSLNLMLPGEIDYALSDDKGKKLELSPWQAAAELSGTTAVPRCLGIAPAPGYAPIRLSAMLWRDWHTESYQHSGNLKLRVIRDELKRRIVRDLPLLDALINSEYVFVTAPRGQERTRGEIDIIVYHLQTTKRVFALRAEFGGRMIAASRWRQEKSGDSEGPSTKEVAVADCSVANQIKAVLSPPAG